MGDCRGRLHRGCAVSHGEKELHPVHPCLHVGGCTGGVRWPHGGKRLPRSCPWVLCGPHSPTRVPLRDPLWREGGSRRRPPGLGREERDRKSVV